MRNQLKNQTQHFVVNYKGKEEILDEQGRKTGEETIVYHKPIMFMGHISGAKGSSQVEIFGTDVVYDKALLISKEKFIRLKIDENSVFFIDKKPQYDDATPLYDYRVKKISPTINEVAIALVKVNR